jgi:hypothetical protein
MSDMATNVHIDYDAMPRSMRQKATASVQEVLSLYAQKVYETRGFDITAIPDYIDLKVVTLVKAFVDRWGVDNSKKIVNAAFGPKHHGQWRDILIAENLFVDKFGWLARALLNEAYSCPPAVENVGFRLTYF